MDTSWEKNSDIHLQIILQKAVKSINNKIGKDFRDKGITVSQFSVLDVLYTKGEMRVCELIEKALSTSGNITVVIKNMEQKGWLYKKTCPTDKRAFLVGLTDERKKLFETLLPEHRNEIKNTYSILSSEEKQELIRILRKFKNI
ncbi:MarR family winged helix-turn-helix transcriptional regulator [Leptotrichia sp. oral taxon 879]|uniref:MarR family winged helix-turn-helix transcriptional regulator n=1 Tax=Leptotrichia sp. oral taxon 879 TaxID=1227267 RepID=UPI0003ADDC7A|nr:MarR family transcriptional regulator [Leptotrichia sp. oral taxon 879]ERK48776.1 transcriptional regulator, MarR family [Leptotrichia sp. oral taxon 879 str. F0557]